LDGFVRDIRLAVRETMASPRSLEQRVFILTGAAGGFGHAIADRLAAAGARLVLWDLDAEALAAMAGPDSLVAPVDVTSAHSVDQAADAAYARFGRIDGLINNAGVLGPLAPTWELSESQFRRVIDVNLIGPFLCTRAVVPLMLRTPRAERHGRIVNIASIQAKEGMHLASAYSAAKAGLVGLTKSLGRELAQEVNAITPAASMTAMSRPAPPERIAEIVARIPMGRLLEPAELAAMTVWLCSDECSYTTAGVFDLSGGRASY
jgi:NAD(P)-dependent dehydrogenase (short-subunit alcohol dehydrogenase family)